MLKTAIAGVTGIFTITMSGPSASMQDWPVPSAPAPGIVQAAPATHWGAPGAFIIAFADPQVVDAYCRSLGPVPPGSVILACTVDATRQVAMPNPCLYQHEYYAKLLCHEQAHLTRPGLTGWRH